MTKSEALDIIKDLTDMTINIDGKNENYVRLSYVIKYINKIDKLDEEKTELGYTSSI